MSPHPFQILWVYIVLSFDDTDIRPFFIPTFIPVVLSHSPPQYLLSDGLSYSMSESPGVGDGLGTLCRPSLTTSLLGWRKKSEVTEQLPTQSIWGVLWSSDLLDPLRRGFVVDVSCYTSLIFLTLTQTHLHLIGLMLHTDNY